MRIITFKDPNFKSMQSGLDISSYSNKEKH